MAFAAKKAGTCATCARPIIPGQLIRWARRGPNAFKAWHNLCNTPTGETPEPNGAEVTHEQEMLEAENPITHQTHPEPISPSGNGDLMAQFAKAIQPFIGSTEGMKSEIMAMVDKRIAAMAPQIVKHELTVTSPSGGTVTMEGKQHPEFAKLIRLFGQRKNVYLFGEAGSGKSTGIIKAAEALGLEHGYLGLTAQTPITWLFGYMDAQGRYVETDFFRLYRDGGVFCLDEMDNANDNILTGLNGALANGKCAFPCGNINRSPNFFIGATGNTPGNGATAAYPGRRVLDASVKSRFSFLEWNTNEELETSLAIARNPNAAKWAKVVQAMRRYAKKNAPRVLVTQRATLDGADLLAEGFTPSECADMLIFQGGVDDTTKQNFLKLVVEA